MRAGKADKGAPAEGDVLSFSFDGKPMTGRPGDTIASALLRNGVRIVGRSFKYHRPRGIWGYWSEEPNALVDIAHEGRTTPNARATTEPLRDGMMLRSVNAWPTALKDRFALLDRFSRFIPAGFYYKTFLWPDWHLFEPRVRAMAGLGRLDPDQRPAADVRQSTLHCEVLVVGAGPAGLSAALAASSAGGSVILVDDRPEPGGSLLFHDGTIDDMPGSEWLSHAVARLQGQGIRLLSSSVAYGIFDHNLTCVWERRVDGPDRLHRIRAGRIVVATGAIERPLVFPDNDRPGVMSAEAALYYLRRHDVLVGRRIVLATNNDFANKVAKAMTKAGADVTLADSRADAAGTGHYKVRRSAQVTAVHGRLGVEAVTVAGEKIPADCLLVSGGFTPTVHLFCQTKGKLRFEESIQAFVPGAPVEGVVVAGAANGKYALAEVLADGHRAGGGLGTAPAAVAESSARPIQAAWPQPGSAGRQWIDFQNDVTLKDVELAARENFRSVEHLKRYSTLGMATDQGKTSNMNGLAAMATITGRPIHEVGTTTYRPPYVPVPFTVIAGRRRGELFNPVRRLVLENEHRAAGAVLRDYGSWRRPAWYGGRDGEAEIRREARQARETVAIFDASPLGKIEVAGPEAASLVDYSSYNTLSTLKPGRIRYGLMLTESGVVYDDGVTLRLGEDHFVISCSSGHVPGVFMRLQEWRQDRLDPSRVIVHNATPQWATLTASGPLSRQLVAALDLGVDLSDEGLPHTAFAHGRFDGAEARIARVSFTGDRSYEISVPASRAKALWLRMRAEGEKLDAVLLGSEALLLLRAEKGYIVVGKDTDGTTMPHDLGVTGPRDKRESEFVGKRSLFTEEASRKDRAQLVGLTTEGREPLPTGAHAVERSGNGRRSIGFVTSSYFSPYLGRPIALGLIENGSERMGDAVECFHLGHTHRARISPICAFDPEGARINA
jgi:sarcosine oxidase, subunit alpha